MADLHCALTDATGRVTAVVTCCNGDPSTCSLHPTRVPDGVAVGPGWTVSAGAFTAPLAPAPAVPTQVTTRQFVLQAEATTLPGASQTLWATIKGMFAQQPALGDVFWASTVIMRGDAMFAAAAQQLGIDAATQDAFFVGAATQ